MKYVSKVIYNYFDYSNLLVVSVREYLLTSRERRILEAFVENGVKLDGFSVLTIRVKRASQRLTEDLELIKAALNKLGIE